jgi:DNA-binding protein HU-beta
MGYGRETLVNKAELIEALSGRLGDRKSATAALDAVLAEIQNAVTKGDKVSITGFGVFEKRVRAARTARNPRTGESVKVKKTSVPAFRPGASFKELVAAGKVPKVAKAAAPAKKAAATATKAAPTKAVKAVKTTTVKKAATTAKKVSRAASTTPRTTTTARTAAKKAPARTARSAAK